MNIIERYKFLIIRLAGQYHIPSYEFDDLVQQGYLSVIKAVSLYNLGSNTFDGYCIHSIRTNFKALLKGKIKHYREVPNSEPIGPNVSDPYSFTLEDEIIAYDEAKRLYAALEKLAPLERAVVERFYLIQDSLKEIACEGEYSYYDYMKIKNKALEKLKKYI
ncbi:sigma-70 family RNA polymerase sigma factor [Clostridium sp. CS001]|uniref:sigma-70 family RNA polymerase sigma factor n=1 Tax=Clostridium sp. CS001 TaxID=2880648 RepID=UPI001CF39B50|nr:sigma-70 family RNA polymerase sigma factor [Clostridium sp. CS001]MCB2289432.1 sigma-70 family RNA polymerase sigma factor [Clostridium sp. CS001]